MSYKLSGINPLAYMGVEPSQPPQMLVEPRSPTINDSIGYNLGTYWLVAAPPPTMTWELWILVDLTAGVATWIQLFPGSGAGIKQLDADVGFAVPTLGIVLVKGGENINTSAAGSVFTVNLNRTIHWPDTTADGLEGAIYLGAVGAVGGTIFMHDYGIENTWLGSNAGNLTLNVGLASDNTGIGNLTLNSLTTGALNTAIGGESLGSVSSGNANFAGGAAALEFLTTGSNNIAIGVNAGQNYTGAESENILLNNPGVLAETGSIRIGVEGTQTNAYMAGIFGNTVGATNQTVIVDNTGKLGSITNPLPGGIIITQFDVSGMWTKNAQTKIVEFYIWNGGSGGGSGGQGASGGASGGGGGSAGNFRIIRTFAQFCGVSETITVGLGGAGGASQAGVNTAGNDGSLGGASGVANLLMTTFPYSNPQTPPVNNNLFGRGGNVGVTPNGAAGAPNIVMDGSSRPTLSVSRSGLGSYSNGSNAQDFGFFNEAAAPPPNVFPQAAYFANYSGGSGGGGGGADSINARTGGNASDFVNIDDLVTLITGAAGGASDSNGSNGVAQPTSGAIMIGGGGGGGGGGMNIARAGIGGNGAVPGGGGGGGGGSINGTISGAGGNGANGRVVVVEYL